MTAKVSSAMDRDDDRPVKKPQIPIGEDLALLSVDELHWRIGVLRQEIMRLEPCHHGETSKSLGGGFRVQTVTLVRTVNLLVRGGE
jgi:uncharacterized small protein (DUF1192 family)